MTGPIDKSSAKNYGFGLQKGFQIKLNTGVKTERANEALPVHSEPLMHLASTKGAEQVANVYKLSVSQPMEKLDDDGKVLFALMPGIKPTNPYLSFKPDDVPECGQLISDISTEVNVRHLYKRMGYDIA